MRSKNFGMKPARVAVALVAVIALLTSCSDDASAGICLPEDKSVARVWNEAALDAIRRDFPAPTVHARNLFHLSAAMWDTWSMFEGEGRPVFHPMADERPEASGIEGATDVAVAFAGHRILTTRYRDAIGGDESVAQFDETLTSLCLTDDMADDPDGPAAAGVAAADLILAATADDGSLESEQYVAPFEVVNDPLELAQPGTAMADPNRWQQLLFVEARTQNGQLLESNVQDYIGPHWGSVQPFAFERSEDGLILDPGPPPLLGVDDEEFVAAAAEVVLASSKLDPADGVLVDIGPGARGNNPLGTDDGDGYELNPVTGRAYQPNVVPAGDFHRVIAEFWADGPDSETPPGHWNTLANQVTDDIDEYLVEGTGEPVELLQWDLCLYLSLNGALHDSAIAAWGTKQTYDYARPISMIRYLGGRGELPLVDGRIETVTEASSAPGERHEALAEYVGETAVLAWAAEPAYFGDELSPVRWIRAVDWMPYQRATFVTPAFPGYVSGHSTFSRAAAEVLTAFTGSEYFPGGMGSHVVAREDLEFDDGPTVDVRLQWATYYDAADEAGLSRIYGGIHVEADDVAGRRLGHEVGLTAWTRARAHFP